MRLLSSKQKKHKKRSDDFHCKAILQKKTGANSSDIAKLDDLNKGQNRDYCDQARLIIRAALDSSMCL